MLLAEDIERRELQLEQVPLAAVTADANEDGKPELYLLVAGPNQILRYEHLDGAWQMTRQLTLLPGDFRPRHKPMVVCPSYQGAHAIFVGCDEGIQIVTLPELTTAEWLTPREKRDRLDWWFADLDGDGRADLLERARESDESLRWYQAAPRGHLVSAQALLDQPIEDATVLQVDPSGAQVLSIDGNHTGLLRRHHLRTGELHELGEQHPYALESGTKAIWCGLRIDGRATLVVVDQESPRLRLAELQPGGWGPEVSFPAVGGVVAVAAHPSAPAELLLWAKEAPELLVSRWENDRLSYPRPWGDTSESDAGTDDRTIVALDSVGATTWWAQLIDRDLHLGIMGPDDAAPRRILFKRVGSKISEVFWLGGDRLLVKQQHARGLQLVSRKEDGGVDVTEPSHLKRADLDDFRLYDIDGTFRVSRIADGVLQWLDHQLLPSDQIMLQQGESLSDFVATSAQGGWALQADGKGLHRVRIDSNGVSSVDEHIAIAQTPGIVRDPVLGIVLVQANRLTVVRRGSPYELELIDTVDDRVALHAGIRESNIHRLATVDIDGDQQDDILVFDDVRHQITVLRVAEAMTAEFSWPVFEDKKYPYADDSAPVVSEPRTVVSLDFDGDGRRDLAMLCHDRVLVYLSVDGKLEEAP